METNFGFQGNPITGGTAAPMAFTISGYCTVSVQVTGTVSAGSYTPQVSNDGGVTWVDIKIISVLNALAATITAVGMYRADVNGYQLFRLNPTSAAGSHDIYLFASTKPLTYQGA